MDFGETGGTLFIVIIMVLLLVVGIFLRLRREQKTPLGMVTVLLSEVNQNQKLIETFNFHWRTKNFKAGSWQRNKARIDFLPQELLATLSNAFGIAEDFNERIDAAKKYKSDSYMASIQVDKLKLPLTKSKQALEEWLQENMQNPEYLPKRRGLFG